MTYEGGDLATQLIRQADNVQIVRVAAFETARDPPQPEYWFGTPVRFQLDVLETLMNRSRGQPPRQFAFLAYRVDPESRQADRPRETVESFDAHPRGWLNLGAMHDPTMLATPDPVGPYACTSRHELQVGDLYVALSNRSGELYHTDGRGLGGLRPHALSVRTSDGSHMAAPTLIRISGADDPFVARLREAITEARGERPRRRNNR